MLYNIINERCPIQSLKNIIGSVDLIEKIQSYIIPTVFKQSYPVLLKLKPKLLDHIMNLMWDETERVFSELRPL